MTTDPYVPDAARWDAFVDWARRFYEWEGFDEAERGYKIETGQRLADAREGFLNNTSDWRGKLRAASGHPHLMGWRTTQAFRHFLESNDSGSANALRSIWAQGEAAPQELISAFAEAMDAAGAGIRGYDNLGSFLLMGLDAHQYPYYQYTPLNAAYQMTEYPRANTRWAPEDKYRHALDFLDEFRRQAAARGLSVHDRLDAQSLVWCVTRKAYFVDEWPSDVREVLQQYRQSKGKSTGQPPGASASDNESLRSRGHEAPMEGPDWSAVADDLTLDRDYLEGLVADLEDKQQMIFHGPPGTGKTYVAKAIAAEYERCGGGSEIVQFHPSYSYEDFVEGFRPKLTDDERAGFELSQGPLKRIAEKAAANPEATYVMVIDELNRGNVAKVFGEMYFLLEYRREAMTLQYSDEPFELPENLFFICTMNTADRSIALVDAALRRRFWFEGFFPDQAPIEGLLRRWLTKNQPGGEWVADLVDHANERLDDRNAAIGPSYFMGTNAELDDERVRRIWRRTVRPYIEEQCYGEEEKLAALEYDRLLSEVSSRAPLPDEAAAGATGEADADGDDAS